MSSSILSFIHRILEAKPEFYFLQTKICSAPLVAVIVDIWTGHRCVLCPCFPRAPLFTRIVAEAHYTCVSCHFPVLSPESRLEMDL